MPPRPLPCQIYRTSPQNMYEYYTDYAGNITEYKKDGMANPYDWLVLFTYEASPGGQSLMGIHDGMP